jgi:hypothetical protein
VSVDLLLLTLCNAAASAVLLFASFAKLVSPAMLQRSLVLITHRESLSTAALVRTIGTVEAAVAVGLMLAASRLVASWAVGLLGIAFVALGIIGKHRHIQEPCGCLGAVSDMPLGWSNVAFGTLFIAASITNVMLKPNNLAASYVTAVPVISGILICAVCLLTSTRILRSASG